MLRKVHAMLIEGRMYKDDAASVRACIQGSLFPIPAFQGHILSFIGRSTCDVRNFSDLRGVHIGLLKRSRQGSARLHVECRAG